MNYFTIKRSIFIVPSKECYEELDKIDKFISILNKSKIGNLIQKKQYNINLDISNQYLDGTKTEANAKKYKFVWKPTTFHKKLDSKIKELLLPMNIEIKDKNLIKNEKLNK